MAIFHLSAKFVSRAKGQSVVASAAYRAGEDLRDETIGKSFSYKKREDEILLSEIHAPDHSPSWATDREKLWNAVERNETRVNSQLAREIVIALPHELTDKENRELVRGFVRDNFVEKGLVADLAIHKGIKNYAENQHAHILITTRTIDADGFGAKARGEHSKDALLRLRESWQDTTNAKLKTHCLQSVTPIDCRSLLAQRKEAESEGNFEKFAKLDREPQIHIGYKPSKERIDKHHEILSENKNRQLAWSDIKSNLRDFADIAREKLREGRDKFTSWLSNQTEDYLKAREQHASQEPEREESYREQRREDKKEYKSHHGNAKHMGLLSEGYQREEFVYKRTDSAPAPLKREAQEQEQVALPSPPVEEHEQKAETHWERINRERREAKIEAGEPVRERRERKPREKKEEDLTYWQKQIKESVAPARTQSKDKDRGRER